MSQSSPTLALPYLQPSQAQKHVTHNEALRILDAVTQLTVLDASLTEPPAAPNEGDRYIIPPGPTGDWSGHGGAVTIFNGGIWEYFTPLQGWRADVIPTGESLRFDGTVWQTLQPELQNLPELGINTTADATNRLASAAEATLLTHDGVSGGHQLKLNKSGALQTASLLFQTAWAGRAEMGTVGSDDFGVKVSPDGSTFHTALEVDKGSGATTVMKRFFSAGLSGTQAGIPDNTHTPVAFDIALSDTHAMFDPATSRLTPPAGAISAIAGVYATNLTAGGICSLGVWKNGTLQSQKVYYAASGGDIGMDVALNDICSGSDYYEIIVLLSTSGNGSLNSNGANTYFRGFHH